MSWQSPKAAERRRQHQQAMLIRVRIQRRYQKLKSFSAVARARLVEIDVEAALISAGLPVPKTPTRAEIIERHLAWARRDRAHVRNILDADVRRAVRDALAQEGE